MERKDVLHWFSLEYREWYVNDYINKAMKEPSVWKLYTNKEQKIFQFIYNLNLISKKESKFKKFENDKFFKNSLFEKNYKEDFMQEIHDYCDKKRAEKLKKQKIAYAKRQKTMKAAGEEFKKKMKIGDVVMVKKRYMEVIDMYENDFTGRYLRNDYTKTKKFENKMYKFITKIDENTVNKVHN